MTGQNIPPLEPIAVGMRDEPEIADLLADFDRQLDSFGILHTTARELWQMPKAPGRPIAVPPKAYQQRMLDTLGAAWNPIRAEYGEPVNLRGYRPPDYNDAVGGSPFDDDSRGSAHMYGEAIDCYTVDRNPDARRRFALIVARFYRDKGRELSMGFGAYGYPAPRDCHVDTGWRRRCWRSARKLVRLLDG